MKKTIAFILIIIVILFLGIIIENNQITNLSNKFTSSCEDLNYEKNLLNNKEKFGELDINIKISKERKWKKIIIKNQLSALENNSYTYDAEYTPVTLIIKNKEGLNCKLLAEIKPHGDLADHFVNFKSGADTIYELPSLKVKILNGNIFGIVEFRLFIPKTRNYSNEIFTATFLEELGFYAPRTTYVNINYDNKITKFIFQEKINKEFLEKNSLQEGLVFTGDERFVFKYKEDSIDSVESGISKHKLTDSKFLVNNPLINDVAMQALQILNESSFFYSSKINQVTVVDYYSSQKKHFYQSYFAKIPKFDAIISAIGANHNLSRDDRRFYYDVVNENFLPLYYDGMVTILDNDNRLMPNNPNFDMSIQNQLNLRKTLNSAKVGAEIALKSIDKIEVNRLKSLLEARGVKILDNELIEIIRIIRNNLLIIKETPKNQLLQVSNKIQNPLKNIYADNKSIKAKYLFKKKNKFVKCDLLLNKCNPFYLEKEKIYLALEQKLKDEDKNDLVFMGEFKNFDKENELKSNISNVYDQIKVSSNILIKKYGEIEVNINKDLKSIDIKKYSRDGRVLILNSFLKEWKIKFDDLSPTYSTIDRRDKNGLSGCINIYDSIIENIELEINKAACEDAVNFVRTNGSIKKAFIIESLFDGIDTDFSNINFIDIDIKKSGNDCLDFSFGIYILNNSSFSDCGDKAISIGENSLLEIHNIEISDSVIGIASKDSSLTKLNNVYIDGVEYCVTSYKKKQEFNGGYIKYDNLVCKNYNLFSNVDKYSKIIEMN